MASGAYGCVAHRFLSRGWSAMGLGFARDRADGIMSCPKRGLKL